MNRILLLSWLYGSEKDCQDGATVFFNKLRTGSSQGKSFPLDCPYEITLVRNQRATEWLVAIRVMRDTPKDDSIEQNEKLEVWFKECDASGYHDRTGKLLLGNSVETTLGPDWDYLDHFGATQENPPSSTSKGPAPRVANPTPVSTICQSCQQSPGDLYSFYYGNETGRTQKRSGKTTTTTTTYRIVGSMQVALCRSCVDKKGSRDAVVNLALVSVLAVALWIILPWVLPGNGWPAYIFPVVFSIIALVEANNLVRFRSDRVFRLEQNNRKETGEKLAIALSTKSLTEKGYNSFFTPNQKSSLS